MRFQADKLTDVLWSSVHDLSGSVNPELHRARAAFEQAWAGMAAVLSRSGERVDITLVEFQPPLAAGGLRLVRWNSWIEAYAIAFFQDHSGEVLLSHSPAVKRYFDVCSGSHALNKKLAVEKAREFAPGVRTDHEADCILMAVFFLKH
jgi:hypothetical protein